MGFMVCMVKKSRESFWSLRRLLVSEFSISDATMPLELLFRVQSTVFLFLLCFYM
jgi:hypothetical protein